MSCWVVPTIAAEIWGVSVDSILHRVRDGSLAHRADEGFLFVQMEPVTAPKVERPPTFTVLSAAEVEALEVDRVEETIAVAADSEATKLDHKVDDDDHEVESQSPDDDEASVDLADFRTARRRVGMTRIPPARFAKPQAA